MRGGAGSSGHTIYAFEYNGYLKIPADGVHTFHAPDEWVTRIPMPGYDLQLWIGGRQW